MTKSISLKVEEAVLVEFPELLTGGFMAAGVDRAISRLDPSEPHLTGAASDLARDGLTVQNLADHPLIQGWRNAFKSMGLKPSTYKSSVEQLARRSLKGELMKIPNGLVSLYCAASVRHLAPLGAYDVESLTATDIALRFARPESDLFEPLGGRKEDMPLKSSVAVYAVDNQVICWAFNHRDSSQTCLRPTTTLAVFIGEGIVTSHHEPLSAALADLRQRLSDLGATVGAIQFASKGATTAWIALD